MAYHPLRSTEVHQTTSAILGGNFVSYRPVGPMEFEVTRVVEPRDVQTIAEEGDLWARAGAGAMQDRMREGAPGQWAHAHGIAPFCGYSGRWRGLTCLEL